MVGIGGTGGKNPLGGLGGMFGSNGPEKPQGGSNNVDINKGGGMSSLKEWFEGELGPQGWKEFESNMMKMISSEFSRIKQEAKKASEKLKKSEKGE